MAEFWIVKDDKVVEKGHATDNSAESQASAHIAAAGGAVTVVKVKSVVTLATTNVTDVPQ